MPDGVQILFNNLPQLIRDYPNAAADGIEATAREGERLVNVAISESPASGITYGNHTASSPGNPPRIDTGNLINSINSHKINAHLWQIRVGAEYSPYLEFGSRYMAARPFMGPMAMELQQKADDIMLEFLRDVV